MAALMGEAVGETVGYRVRLDRRVGPKTRIESVTTGLFLRQLQGDPELWRSPSNPRRAFARTCA
jgi:ATP-dependent helicase HrpB